MAELADALDSGSSEGSLIQVQVLLSAPLRASMRKCVVEVLLFCSFSLVFQVRYENPHQAKSTLLRTFCNFSHMKQLLL